MSCHLGSREVVELKLPVLPENMSYLEDDGDLWLLEFRDGSGDVIREEIPFSSSGYCSIEVEKESPLLCLLYPPAFSENFSHYPAGGVYEPGNPHRINLSWKDGAGVSFLMKAALSGVELNSLNMEKLLGEIRAKEFSDPWDLDWSLLGRQLIKGEMRSWYIRENYQFELEIPGFPGRYLVPSYALQDPVESSGGDTDTVFLSEGTHRFLDRGMRNSGDVLVLEVDDQGESFSVLYQRTPSAGSSQLMGGCPVSSR
jgi:hypothetical protein